MSATENRPREFFLHLVGSFLGLGFDSRVGQITDSVSTAATFLRSSIALALSRGYGPTPATSYTLRRNTASSAEDLKFSFRKSPARELCLKAAVLKLFVLCTLELSTNFLASFVYKSTNRNMNLQNTEGPLIRRPVS